MKYIFLVILFVICCVVFIPIIINMPIETNYSKFLFNIIWSAVAIFLGGFAVFFPKKFNIGNARIFEKLNEKTNIPILKKMAEETLKPFNTLNTRLVGIFFLIIGFIGFIGLFKYFYFT